MKTNYRGDALGCVCGSDVWTYVQFSGHLAEIAEDYFANEMRGSREGSWLAGLMAGPSDP